MKIVRNQNIWSKFGTPDNIVVVTTNQEVCSYGLVMGAGTALEAKKRVPQLPMAMKPWALHPNPYFYKEFPEWGIGCFQTKIKWKEPTPINVLRGSLVVFHMYTTVLGKDRIYHCPKFGCGFGGLSWDKEVLPLINEFSFQDNVIFYE